MLDWLINPDDEVEEDLRTEEEREAQERDEYENRQRAEDDWWDNEGFDDWEAKHL